MQWIETHLGQGKVRPWSEFADIQKLKLPRDPSVASFSDRLAINLSYFALNYLLVALACLTCLVVLQPFVLVILGGEVGIVWWLYVMLHNSVVRIPTSSNSNAQVPRVYLLAISLVATGTLLGVVAGIYFFVFLALGMTLIFGHALLRARSASAKISTFIHEKLPLGQKPSSSGIADAILSDVITQVDVESDRVTEEEARRRNVHLDNYHQLHDKLKQKYTTNTNSK